MNTHVIIAVVALVLIAVVLIGGGALMDRSRKRRIMKAEERAKAKADENIKARKAAEQRESGESDDSGSESGEGAKAGSGKSGSEEKPADSGDSEDAENAKDSKEAEGASDSEGNAATSDDEKDAKPSAATGKSGAVDKPESATSRVTRLKAKLGKSANPFGRALFNILAKDHLSASDWEDVEDTLLLADVGSEASEKLVDDLRDDARITGASDPKQVREALRSKLVDMVDAQPDRALNADKPGAHKPSVIIMVGVNGTGKTTTAGKLARLFVAEGKSVMLGAADTFRAAAADQLETWGQKVGVPVVRSDKEGADPASVAFEASRRAKDEDVDVLIIDTAGRLQNKSNLMDELGKIRRVTEKNLPVDEVLLVLDATTGQNGMTQAKVFAEAIGLTGVVLSKLDGSAKGGIVVSVQRELEVPVKLVGLGEGPDDLAPFDPEGFVDGILA
ncbi:signal recognition particle-docking protein FtsY [Bifidobacterium sp. ESL0763]|uniref:signal recognition particle-docking protein FtsY n=1 Tax=Bifidobacterium sp. ESL0763 TaxID=2983227 RepID=UPI0023F9C33E|nr:signal recognition particle-docking protein FtsY [Bifidobacterium sp. ESL0763]MDF7664453.1 signal recognition particle-docking protein FtsY [Bifidobacterium sp. ESL0763]